MRLASVHIEGFRSIRELHLSDLGPIVSFYGPNGAGKSNILAAIDLFLQACTARAGHQPPRIALSDLRPNAKVARIGADFHLEDGARRAQVRWQFEASSTTAIHVAVDGQRASIHDVLELAGAPADRPLGVGVPAIRGAGWRQGKHHAGVPPVVQAVQFALDGAFEDAMFVAQNSPDADLYGRMQRLQALLTGPPLSRPPFRAFEEHPGGPKGVQEMLSRAGSIRAVPLNRAGLGVEQLYAIVSAIVLSGAPIVTLEEPEAHLYERGSARDLRALLKRLVPDTAHQLFIATHSSQFALDPTQVWSVVWSEEQGTLVERAKDPLDLFRHHVFEPGAARLVLAAALQRGEPDRIVAHRADGGSVLASEMLELLDDGDDVAMEFLESLTSAALRLVAQGANKP